MEKTGQIKRTISFEVNLRVVKGNKDYLREGDLDYAIERLNVILDHFGKRIVVDHNNGHNGHGHKPREGQEANS